MFYKKITIYETYLKKMKHSKWFFHPLFVFIFSILALGTSLFLYIYWYMRVRTGVENIIRQFNIDSDKVLTSETWVVVLVLSVLVGIILIGIFTIFVYGQKTFQLFRLQNNFINNFTHELKTPVTSLKLYLETFLEHDISRKDQIKYIKYMLHDVDRLSDNITRILSLARIESRNYGGEFIKSDLVRVTKEFCDNNRHIFPGCTIRIKNSLRESVLYPINISLFEMLLMNIITNAVKYNLSEEPGVEIVFKQEKRHLHIEFSDNGMGIEKKELKKIFRKFYQVGRSDNMSAKGSGLGLYLVQNIARIHKGKVVAESSGKGSVFTLILPFKKPRKSNRS